MVINPVTSDLTTAAKTIITNPTFLPDTVESAAVFGGEAEASGALAAASPVMGVAGAALGVFGLGVGVGTLICHAAGIEGCLFDQADSADPTAVAYSWQWQETYAQWRWSAGAYNFKGLNGSPSNCGREPGAGYSYWKVLGTLENCSATQPDHKNLKLDEIELWRYGTANRTFSHVTDAQASSLESEGRVKKRLDPSESSTKEYGTKLLKRLKVIRGMLLLDTVKKSRHR